MTAQLCRTCWHLHPESLNCTEAQTIRMRVDTLNNAARWRKLLALAGHYQNGSETTVILSQDDATRSCIIRVGKHMYSSSSFEGALALIPEPEQES